MPKVKASLSNDDRIEKMQELLSGDEASEEAEAEVNKKRLSELRNLIFLGKLKESIEIGGFVFSLTTLLFGLLDNFGVDGGKNGFVVFQSIGKFDVSFGILFLITNLT